MFTSKVKSTALGSTAVKGATCPSTPALLINTSTLPNVSTACLTNPS